jgi:hypothetical protein
VKKTIPQHVLQPKPTKPGMIEVKGGDVIEALRDPKKDILLLRAKRQAAYAKATHLSDSELRGVSWFAHLPAYGRSNVFKAVFDERNFNVSSFWSAWVRDPAAVLRLVTKIRESSPQQDVEEFLLNNKTITINDSYSKEARVKRARKQLKPTKAVAKFADAISKSNPPQL